MPVSGFLETFNWKPLEHCLQQNNSYSKCIIAFLFRINATFQNLFTWTVLLLFFFFSVLTRRQDLTSILVNSTNWFSDAYPVAHMRWVIIAFVSNKTHIFRGCLSGIIWNCIIFSNSLVQSSVSCRGLSFFHSIINWVIVPNQSMCNFT